ncbi:MAG: flippase-like domain-containing protein, partial [Actinobacteria bacterium]|nr:flippase-like domain-containing protein [Actinomycetota bacterium]
MRRTSIVLRRRVDGTTAGPRAAVASASTEEARQATPVPSSPEDGLASVAVGRVRDFGRRRRVPLVIAGSLATAAVLAWVLAGRRHEFAAALSGPSVWVLVASVGGQIVALLARSEAWHLSIEAAGGTVERRVLFRASAMQVVGGMINGQLGVAARIAALRRSSPEVSPLVPTLVAAEFPILAVEGILAAVSSFTLVGPLGLPWWLPLVVLAVVGTASAGLRHLALRKGRELWRGLAVARSLSHGSRLIGFVLVAVAAQIFRNWLLLHAVGVDASLFDAVAVLIAVSTLGQLPLGPAAGAASAVLILGSDGVAAAAAAGVLMTVTGTVGGLCFAAWSFGDRVWSGNRRSLLRRARRERLRQDRE